MADAMTLTVEQLRRLFDAGVIHGMDVSHSTYWGDDPANTADQAFEKAASDIARASLSRTEVQGVVAEGWVPIPYKPGDPQPRISGGVWRGIRTNGAGGFEGIPVKPPAPSTDAREGEDDPDSPQERLALVEGMLRIIMDNPGQAKLYARVALDFIEFTQAERLEMRGEAALASGGRGDE
jgi:hypothetical protein